MENTGGLYRSEYEHDACGVGFIAHIKGQKSHSIVSQALEVLKNLRHRGAVGADPLQGDGAGILIQIPDQLYRDDMMNQGVKLPPASTPEREPYEGKRRAPPVRKKSSVRCAPKDRSFSAGATCRSTATCRCRPSCARRSR